MKPVDMAFPLPHWNVVQGSCGASSGNCEPHTCTPAGQGMREAVPGLIKELINGHAAGVGAQGFSSVVGRGQGEQGSDISPSSLINSVQPALMSLNSEPPWERGESASLGPDIEGICLGMEAGKPLFSCLAVFVCSQDHNTAQLEKQGVRLIGHWHTGSSLHQEPADSPY